MARVELSAAAVEDIARLEVTHSLPPDTRARIRRSLRSLVDFPRLGRALEGGGWDGFRFVLGPWRWMIVVYEYDEETDRIVVATIQDGRASMSARS